MAERSQYIVIEGSDGTGKSTVANLVADQLRNEGRQVIRVDEPDSAYNEAGEVLVPIASELRRIIKDGSLGRTALTNVLLFTASRRENWLQVSQPALEQGIDVVSARNYWSTLVYQGHGEGFDLDTITNLTHMSVGDEYMKPDHGFILDLNDEEERKKRIANRGALETPDTFESKGDDFQAKLRAGYLAVALEYGLPIIDVKNKSRQALTEEVIELSSKKS